MSESASVEQWRAILRYMFVGQLNLLGSKSALIGAYYKPHELDEPSLTELAKSLNLVNQSNKNIIMSSFKSSRDIQKTEGGPDSCFG